MTSLLLGNARNLRSIVPLKGNALAKIRIAATGKRYVSQEKPISRFPVPNMDTLPQDMQETMKEVEEKVPNLLLFCCFPGMIYNHLNITTTLQKINLFYTACYFSQSLLKDLIRFSRVAGWGSGSGK